MPNPVARDSRATGSSWPPRPRRLGCTTPEQTVRRQNQPRTPEGCSQRHGRPPDPRATEGRKRCTASKTQTHRARERTPRLTGRAPQMSVGRENPPALCTQAKAVGSLAPGPKASEGGDRARRRGRRRPWGRARGAQTPFPGQPGPPPPGRLLWGTRETGDDSQTRHPLSQAPGTLRSPEKPSGHLPEHGPLPRAVPASAPDNGRPRREA